MCDGRCNWFCIAWRLVCESVKNAYPRVVFIFVEGNMEGDQFRPHDGMCLIVTGCIYICGSDRGRVNNRGFDEGLAFLYRAVRVYPFIGIVKGKPYCRLRRYVRS